MSGKEIKAYIARVDDIYYNVIVLDENGNAIGYNDIIDDVMYEFTKIEEFNIGCGMVKAYYSIKE